MLLRELFELLEQIEQHLQAEAWGDADAEKLRIKLKAFLDMKIM